MSHVLQQPLPTSSPLKPRAILAVALAVGMLALGSDLAPSSVRSQAPASPAVAGAAATVERAKATFADMPLAFVENAGQVQSDVSFLVQGSDTSLGFLDDSVVWRLTDRDAAYAVRQSFVGGRAASPVGVGALETTYSWFKGAPSQWTMGAAAFSAVRYEEVWPGIDVVYSGDASQVKYRFVVAPGADPSAIRMAYRGADISLAPSGDLRVATPVRTFTDTAPRTYQGATAIPSSYVLGADGTYTFDVGAYASTKPLIIDPAAVVYAGFVGGSGSDYGNSIAVDNAGAAYITGYTDSTEADFPVTGGPDLTSGGGGDAFVAKVTASGSSLAYVGYIGGSGFEEGRGIGVDSAGAAYITGYTDSNETQFPVSGGPDLTYNGGGDAFVAKVTASGASLAYAGYIGGANSDAGRNMVVLPSGAIILGGNTDSTEADFPVSGGPDLTFNGSGDVFVAKVAASGASLAYAGYVGGTGYEENRGIAVDSLGAAYLTGYTDSTEATFPVAVGPDLTYNDSGSGDAYVVKVAVSGASLDYAGYVGGATGDYGDGVAVNAAGNAYLTGFTDSDEATFPVSGGPDLTYNGGGDGFVAKVSVSGTALVSAGYIGGAGYEEGRDIAVDGASAAYVTGATDSDEATFPVSGGPDLTYNGNSDAFIAKLRPSAGALAYAGYIGGSGGEDGRGIAVEPSGGAAYITGYTDSTEADFPLAGGPDLTANGLTDAYVAKVGPGPAGIYWDPVSVDRVTQRPLTCNTPVASCTDAEAAWTMGAPALAASEGSGAHHLHTVWTTDAPTGDGSNATVDHSDACATGGPGGTPYCSGVYYARSGDAGEEFGGAGTWDGGSGATAPFSVGPLDQHVGRPAIATSGPYVYVAYVTTTGYGDEMCADDARVLWARTNTNYGASNAWEDPVQLTGALKEVDYPSIDAAGAKVWVIFTRADSGDVKVATSTNNATTFTNATVGHTTATYDNKIGPAAPPCSTAPIPDGLEGWSGRASIAGSGSLVGATWIRNASGRAVAKLSEDGGTSFFTGPCDTAQVPGKCTMHLSPEGTLGPDGRSSVSVSAANGNRLAYAWVYGSGLVSPEGVYVRSYSATGGWGSPRLISCLQNSSSCTGAPAAQLYDAGYGPSIAMYGTTGLGVSWSACPYPGPTTPCDESAGDPGAELLWKESWDNGASWSGGQGSSGPWGSYRLLAANTGTDSPVNERATVVFDDRSSGGVGCAQQTASEPVGIPVSSCQRYVLFTGHTRDTTWGRFVSGAATSRVYLSIGSQD